MSEVPRGVAVSLRYGWRRRCAWCGVVLRGWQVNRCKLCRSYGRSTPPCEHASRWDAEPDTIRP